MFPDSDTETYHLYEMYDGDESNIDYDELRAEREDGVTLDVIRYRTNKNAKVGSIITCAGPLCNKKFRKKSYQQCFCCTRHKDQFWNRREAHYGFRKPVI